MLTIVFVAILAVCSAAPAPFDPQVTAVQYFKDHPLIIQYMYADADDCTKYYSAFKTPAGAHASSITCPTNTHWNNEIKTCTWGPCPTAQQVEACSDEKNAFIKSADDCSAFYTCIHAYKEPGPKQCCPANTEFSVKENRCVESKTCTKSCEPTYVAPPPTTPGPPPTSCINGDYKYEKVDGDDNKYKQTNIKNDQEPPAVMSCPADHSFNLVECGCVNNKEVKYDPDVKKECVLLDFDKIFSAPNTWVGDVKSELENGEACFKGDGYLNVPYLNNVAYSKFQVSFKYTNKGGDCVLLTNGNGKLISASFEVAVVGENLKVTLVTKKGIFTVEAKSVDAKVLVTYNGSELELAVGDVEKKVAATGHMLLVNHDLILGRGLTGCLDDLSFCPMK